ncbi:MAG: excinuclease ABC subunit UvrC [Oligoflexia bacterium]|nr:excinuclease ABC subunit UvrC [Oligoflexia bacterium]
MARNSKSDISEKLTELKASIAGFPTTPGIYLMKNAIDKIIYVGKAKVLRSRVRSYFTGSGHSAKTQYLVSHISKIEYIVTKTEVEAFLLEASLIKKHRPKYNIRLKDDKTYPYIKVSMADDYPRLYLSRKVKRDGSMYFGPFTSGLAVWETIKFLNRTFQIRDCSDHYFRNRTRPCLTHQIGNCTAPCVDIVDKETYQKDIQGALLFLRGKDKLLLKEITKRMKEAANDEQFEYAAKLRDSLEGLESILEKQSVINAMGEKDQDVIGYEGDERGCTIEVLHVRQGKLLGSQPHFMPLLNPTAEDENPQEWLASFVNQYYEENMVPDEVLLGADLGRDIHKLLEAVLCERTGKKVVVRYPTSQDASRMLEIAQANASEHFKHHVTKTERKHKGLEEIKERLGLSELPMRIECYDISNFQGAEAVASQVVFEEGVPSKDWYRRYKIKTVQGANDFAMMKEVLSRRMTHVEQDEPQLIVVDGGKGQLSMAVAVLEELKKTHIPVIGFAKARTLGKFDDADVKGSEERVFLPGRQNPVTFAKNSEALHILVGIRDEAHRFAISYHRKLRENRSLESELDHIVGLGEKRKKALLRKFESIDQLKCAPAADIAMLPGFNSVLAERVLLQLNEDESSVNEDTQPSIQVEIKK